MKALLEAIFGTYVPVTYPITGAAGVVEDIIPSGLAGVDWTYVLGVVLFGIVLYSALRILGGILKR